jgi:putative copper export protein
MLPIHSADVRLFLHILGATVWVGGQVVLATLVPVLRRSGPDTAALVARRFQSVAWAAFVLLLGTGAWNLAEVGLSDQRDQYVASLALKLGFVATSGIAAAGHAIVAGPRVREAETPAQQRQARVLSAVTGAVALLAALAALFVGVQLRMS